MQKLHEPRQRLYKKYVDVLTVMGKNEVLKPVAVLWDNGIKYEIDRVLQIRNKASSVGGCGLCYECVITVYVKNSAEAKKFWTENMGFVIREEQLMGPGMTWLETAPDYHAQTTIVLFERSRMEKANPQVSTAHPSVMFTCADIEEEHRRLLSNGVIVDDIQKYPYGRMFSFYDQDHQVYLLREA